MRGLHSWHAQILRQSTKYDGLQKRAAVDTRMVYISGLRRAAVYTAGSRRAIVYTARWSTTECWSIEEVFFKQTERVGDWHASMPTIANLHSNLMV